MTSTGKDAIAGVDDAVLLTGGPIELGSFYERYERPILGWFLQRVRRADVAADLAAETFARVVESRHRFDPDLGEPRAWLYAIARNVLTRSFDQGRVQDEARRRLAMEPLMLEDEALVAIEAAADVLATEALAVLPPEQAVAVRGRVIDERPYAELAAELGCSESVVRQRVSRGLKTMRATLKDRT